MKFKIKEDIFHDLLSMPEEPEKGSGEIHPTSPEERANLFGILNIPDNGEDIYIDANLTIVVWEEGSKYGKVFHFPKEYSEELVQIGSDPSKENWNKLAAKVAVMNG